MGRRTAVFVLLALLAAGSAAFGHFHTFWPDSANGYGRLGQPIKWRYFWGHPYEMIIFDAEPPTVYAVTPDGQRADVALTPVEMQDPDTGEQRQAFAFEHTPADLGDTWIVLEAPPYTIEEEGEAVQDYVKQCVHVMAESGWDRRLGLPIELVPLTRPYGLEAGFAFTARAYLGDQPLAGAAVEIEKSNRVHVSSDDLPKDQFGMEDVPMITRSARTDAHGYVTYTLDEPGWWMISVAAPSGTVTAAGEELPRVLRGGLWVNVQESFTVGD